MIFTLFALIELSLFQEFSVMAEWQHDGKWKIGHPKTAWRKTKDKKCRQDGWVSWAKARGTAHDRDGWKAIIVTALCTAWLREN